MGDNRGPAEKAALSFTLIFSLPFPTFTHMTALFLTFFLHLYNELQANVCVWGGVLKFTFYLFKDCVCT